MLNNNEIYQINDVDDLEQVAIEKEDTVQKESSEEKYSIYNHLKSHPASAVATFSALVTTITFFAQLMTYIINKNVLEYWGYNVSYASLGNDSLLYSAISAIVYGLVLAVSIVLFLKTCDAYLERKHYFLTVKYLLKKKQKCEKENLRLLNLTEQSNNDIEELDTVKSAIINTSKEIKDFSKTIRKEIFLARLAFFKNLVPILLLSIFSAFIMSLMLTQDIELWLSMIVILIVQLLTFALLYYMEKKSSIKKNQIKKSVATLETKEILEKSKYKKQYPLDSLSVEHRGIKNSTFFILITYVLAICVVFVGSFGYSAKDNESKRKTFEVVNLSGEAYVVVHHDNNTCFLEKAIISNDVLTIYINHQRIVNSSDVAFTVKTFDTVIKDDSEVLP